jgi:type IV pilus assembly protein PilW
MVALVIGMIGVLIIMQVARTAEAQKRMTTGSGETQSNAALAMYSVERDLKQAGYGISSLNVLGCPLSIPVRDSLPARTLDDLAPVMINPPEGDVPKGDGDTDTLLIVYGDSAGSPEGDRIPSILSGDAGGGEGGGGEGGGSGGRQYIGVKSAANFRVKEWIIAARPEFESDCTSASGMRKIQEILDPDSSELGFQYTIVVDGGEVAVEDGLLFGLGPAPRLVGYAVRDGNLASCNYMQADCSNAANWTAIANGIVSLRAQYGRDTDGDGAIDEWTSESPPADSSTEYWASVLAVRLALVARNSEPAGSECANDSNTCPTQTAPSWTGSLEDPDDVQAKIVLSANAAWKHYRYQVYETVVPLRNIPWMAAL